MAADTVTGRTLVALGGEVLTEVASHLEKAATALHYLGMPQRAAAWDPANWLTTASNDRLADANRRFGGASQRAAHEAGVQLKIHWLFWDAAGSYTSGPDQ